MFIYNFFSYIWLKSHMASWVKDHIMHLTFGFLGTKIERFSISIHRIIRKNIRFTSHYHPTCDAVSEELGYLEANSPIKIKYLKKQCWNCYLGIVTINHILAAKHRNLTGIRFRHSGITSFSELSVIPCLSY